MCSGDRMQAENEAYGNRDTFQHDDHVCMRQEPVVIIEKTEIFHSHTNWHDCQSATASSMSSEKVKKRNFYS